jgi:RHS repeat-associated protein
LGADVWSYRYDDAGTLRSATHGSSTWQYAHGPRGELTSVTQPDGTVFTYGRNELAELSSIAVSTAAGNPAEAVPSRTFDHDHLGRETRRTRGTTVWTTSWASGRGTTTRSGGSDQVSLVLDGRGRVLARGFVNGPESVAGHTSIAYAYNGLGELMQAVEQGADGTITTVFRHDDPRGLLTRIERDGAPSVVYGRRPTSGDVESVTVGSSSVTYGFDGFGRVSSIDGAAGTVSVGWEAGGARIESLSGGGLHEKRCYDGAGRLTEVLNATSAVLCGAVGPELVAGYVYRYQGDAGARGNRTSETIYTEGAAPQTTTFGYDAADRLTGVQYPDRAVLYRLAADGTRLAEKAAPDVADLGPAGWVSMVGTTEHVAYHYDGRGGLTSLTDELSGGATIATWTVDAAGRVTSETRGGMTKTFGWDAEGRLREVTLAPPAPALPYTVSYAYDHAGRRVRKSGPGGVSTYLWGQGELVTESPAGGSTVVYQRLGGDVVGIGGERVLHDGLGSVVGRATSYGVPTQYRYDAWGAFRGDARPRAGAPSLAYAGQHWDEEVGLSYAQQRWYQPETGRFLSEDPVGPEGRLETPSAMHVFGYAAANPLRFTDPNGTCPGGDCGLAKQWAEDDSELARLCKVEHNEQACKLMKAEGVAAAGVVAAGVAVALAPAVPAVATQVAVSVGNAGGGAMVAEEATAAGLLAVAGKQCVEAPSLESCGTAVFLALTRRSPGAARGGKSSAAPSPGSGAQVAAVEEPAAIEARGAVPTPRSSATSGGAAPAAGEPLAGQPGTPGTAIVKYDPKLAAEQLLGESWETQGGRTISPHAAQQMTKPPPGRVPMTKDEVDVVLDTATKVRKVTVKPEGDTVTVQRPDLPGKPQVVVDAATGKRVVTVIKNKDRQ